MENYLKKIRIFDLFQAGNNYEIDFTEGCNCIYGKNGSGKTTIINIIVDSLNCNDEKLFKQSFSKIQIYLSKTGKKKPYKFLEITKSSNNKNESQLDFVIYGFNNENLENLDSIKRIIQKNIKLTHVPLLRIHDSEYLNNFEHKNKLVHDFLRSNDLDNDQIEEILDPSLRVLSSLQKQFIDESHLATKKITNKLEIFKSRIIEKLMIDESLQQTSQNAFRKASKIIESNIHETYDANIVYYIKKIKEAQINIPESKIIEHFNLLKKQNELVKSNYNSIKEIPSTKNNQELLQNFTNSYYALIAMNNFNDRFTSIIENIESLQQEKAETKKIFSDYEQEICNYFNSNNKEFSITEDGIFQIKVNSREIKSKNLSSGEKHILTILGRAALTQREGTVFVADEPELSLHLDWQRMILSSIIKLSPKSQIIVATHSPSITAKNANEIDLEDCKK